jgi:hypothetical protein
MYLLLILVGLGIFFWLNDRAPGVAFGLLGLIGVGLLLLN